MHGNVVLNDGRGLTLPMEGSATMTELHGRVVSVGAFIGYRTGIIWRRVLS